MPDSFQLAPIKPVEFKPVSLEPQPPDSAGQRLDDLVNHSLSYTGSAIDFALNSLDNPYKYDPSFSIDDPRYKPLLDGLPDEAIPAMAEARSASHAYALRRKIIDQMQASQRLDNYSILGSTKAFKALSMGTSIFDPTFLAANAVTFGAAEPFIMAEGSSVLARGLKSGLVGAATQIPLTALDNSQDPLATPDRFLRDALFSGVLTGAFGAYHGKQLMEAQSAAVKAIEMEAVMRSGAPLTPEGLKVADGIKAGQQQFIRDAIEAHRSDAVIRTLREVTKESPTVNQVWPPVEPPPPSWLRSSASELRRTVPDGVRIVDDLNLGARVAADGAVEVGGRFEKAPYNERRMMAEMAILRPAASEWIADAIEQASKAGTPAPSFEDVILQKTHGLTIADARVVADDIRDSLHGRVPTRESLRKSLGQQPANTSQITTPANPKAPPSESSVGAATASEIADIASPKSSRGAMSILGVAIPDRFDIVGWLGRSESPTARDLGRRLGRDILPNEAGEPPPEPLSAALRRETSASAGNLVGEVESAFNDWAKENQVSVLKRDAARKQFNEMVGQGTREAPGDFTDDPHVNQAIEANRAFYSSIDKRAQEAQLEGYQPIADQARYFPRFPSGPKLHEAEARFGSAPVEQLVAKAIRQSGETPESALQRARGYILIADTAADPLRDIATKDTLRAALSRRGIAADEIEKIVEGATVPTAGGTAKDGTGTVRHAEHRIAMDESASIDVTSPQTGLKIGELSMADILENHASSVAQRYARSMMSTILEKQILDDFKAPDFKTLYGNIQNEMLQRGKTSAQAAEVVDSLRALRNLANGIPIENSSRLSSMMKIAREFNNLRLGGRIGEAHLSQTAVAVATMGMRSAIEQLPILKNIFSRARLGAMPDGLVSDIERIWSPGTERLMALTSDGFARELLPTDSAISGTRSFLRKGRTAIMEMNGMVSLRMALKRLTIAGQIQTMTDRALSDKPPSERRLAVTGLSRDMWDRIATQIKARQREDTTEGTFGRRVVEFNPEQWTDREAASAAIHHIDTVMSHVMNDGDPGLTALWMNKEWARTLFQYRIFSVNAYNNFLKTNLYARDWEAFSKVIAASITGTLVYTGQRYVDSIGRPDAEEYRDKMLSPGAIIAGGLHRGGFASLFPGVFDSVGYLGGSDNGMFGNSRTVSGLASGLVEGIPAVDLVDTLGRAVHGTARSAWDSEYDFSKQDARRWWRLAPFSNLIGMKNVSENIFGPLPDQSRSGGSSVFK